MIVLADEIVIEKTSSHTSAQFIFVFVTELQMNITEEFVDVRQLENFLVRNDEYQFKLIVELVL